MEGTVSDSEISLKIVSVRVFLVTLEDGKSSNKISLFEEVSHIWKFIFFLLLMLGILNYLLLSDLLRERFLFALNCRSRPYHF